MTALLGVGAFAVDLGLGWAVKRQLSVSADAAALAGAQEAGIQYKGLGSCGAIESVAEQTVSDYFTDNPPQGENISVTADADACTDSNKVTVAVEVTSDLGTVFGGVINVDTMTPGSGATADVFGARVLTGLRPFTVCMSDALAGAADGNTYQSVYKNHNTAPDGSCNPTGAPGNWGYTTFGLGNSDNTVLCLIENGYGAECGGDAGGVDVGAPGDPVDADGYTGNSIQGNPNTESKDVQALNSLLNQTILLPVADDDSWASQGNNASYDGMGAIAVEFCGWAMPQGKSKKELADIPHNTGDCWDNSVYDAQKVTWVENQDVPSLVIQWQYRDNWVTSSVGQDPADGCPLGNDLCIPALRLVK
jgi:hypothetical protein